MGTNNAINNNLGVLTTLGDLLVGTGFGTTNVRLPIGTNTYVLTADSSQPLGLNWEPPPTNSFARIFAFMGG
jgi:hypothetical protein